MELLNALEPNSWGEIIGEVKAKKLAVYTYVDKEPLLDENGIRILDDWSWTEIDKALQ